MGKAKNRLSRDNIIRLLPLLALALVLTAGVRGTLAGDPGATLDVSLSNSTATCQVVPGFTQELNGPRVDLQNNSHVPCYLFVQISGDAVGLIEWEMAPGWNELTGVPLVYWRETDGTVEQFPVFQDNCVSYPAALTRPTEPLSLQVKAYVIGKTGQTGGEAYLDIPAEAWGIVSGGGSGS